MATSEVQICNMSLSHLGVSKNISSLDERSKEAEACDLFYEQARDEVLRDFDWSFARRSTALTLVEEDPTDEWLYSYRFPSDAVAIRRITNQVSRIETSALATKTLVVGDASGRLIYTDQEDSVVVYTSRVTAPEMFPPDFTQALSLKLAVYIAPRVTQGDEFGLGKRSAALYEYMINTAKANDANESVADLQPDSEFITVRE